MEARETFLDKLSVASTCAVVLLHTVTGVMDTTDMDLYPLEKKVFLVALDLVCWCVPVFLLISGYLFLNPARKISAGKMLWKYCRRIVLALFLFGVPYAWMEEIAREGSFSAGMLGKGFVMVIQGRSWSHMWYLYLILLLYLITPALRWMLARIPRGALYGLLGLLFFGSGILPFAAKLSGREPGIMLPDDGIYLFYYLCGHLFALKRGEIPASGKTGGRLPALGALLLAAGMAVSRLPGTYTVQMAYNYPFTVVLSLLLFGWAMGAGISGQRPGRINFPWEKTAVLSFAIYLVHPVFLNIAYKLFHVTPLSFPVGISLPLFFLGTLLLSAGAAWVLQKIAPLRKYVL